MIKPSILALCLVLACGVAWAQTLIWQPSPGHTQVPIWPGAVPDAQPVPGSEYVETSKELIGGRPTVWMSNISQPTMTVYSPTGKKYGRCGCRVSRRGL